MSKRIPDTGMLVPENVRALGRRAVKSWQQSVINHRTYRNWYRLFYDAMLSRFEWTGLPPEIDPRYLEVLLTQWGCFAFTKLSASVDKYWIGTITNQTELDIYTNPTEIRMIGANGFQQVRHCSIWKNDAGDILAPNAYVCWDNMGRMPIFDYVDTMAARIASLDTTIDQHMLAQRMPYAIAVNEEGRKNASELFRKIANGEPAIYVNSDSVTGTPSITVLPTANTTNYNGGALIADQNKLVAQVYTRLGIDNDAQADKRERVQTAETLSNNEQIMIQRFNYLKPRMDFCEHINSLFGLNVSVKWSIRHVEEDTLTFPGTEVETTNVNVHGSEGSPASDEGSLT